MIIQFADAFHVIGKLQAVEVGKLLPLTLCHGLLRSKIRWKVNTTSSAFILRVGVNQSVLKRNIATQVEAIGRAVVEYFPAFGKFRHQAIGIGIDIQQSIIKLGGKGIDN